MPSSLKTSVLIAEPHALLREGIKGILANDPVFKVIAEVIITEELHAQLKVLKPDLIIIDYHTPGHFSIDDIPAIYDLSPSSTVLVLTSNQNKTDILKILEYGVNHYIIKKCGKEDLS